MSRRQRIREQAERLVDVLKRRGWIIRCVRSSGRRGSRYVHAAVRADWEAVTFRVADHPAKRRGTDVHVSVRECGGLADAMSQVIAWEAIARGRHVWACPVAQSSELLVDPQPATSAVLVRGRAADDAGGGGGVAAERSSDKGRSDGAERRHEAPRSEPRSRGGPSGRVGHVVVEPVTKKPRGAAGLGGQRNATGNPGGGDRA